MRPLSLPNGSGEKIETVKSLQKVGQKDERTIDQKNVLTWAFSLGKPTAIQKIQFGDSEHRITLCEIISIKTDNIGGYIIKLSILYMYRKSKHQQFVSHSPSPC